ncbi:hypothetical protein LCGC14_1539160 [marine sediment metagenome]|uniref:DUF2877 domain-containing protein n=1 Tax=marine sediment metagenome TaxID=412755 RepID=A0A0F9LUD0_9ZZZZ
MTDSESPYYRSGHQAKSLYLNAQSIGLSADDRIQIQGKIGLIHSIFQRVINITVLENQLISLVGQEVGQGPLNILVNIPKHINLLTIGIKRGDIVTRVGESIVIGENVIEISTQWTELWEPKRKFQTSLQPLKTIMANIEIMRDIALASDHLSGLGELIPFTHINGLKDSKTEKLGSVSHLALPHISSMLKAIKSGHSHDIIRITKHLVGLGPGLTPAADDMLLGLMISMLYISENFNKTSIDVKKINKDIISIISGRTTIISEEFLREASVGKVNEAVASLMENLLTSRQREVENSVRKLLDLGGTSGTDTVLGVILGSHLMLIDIDYNTNKNECIFRL